MRPLGAPPGSLPRWRARVPTSTGRREGDRAPPPGPLTDIIARGGAPGGRGRDAIRPSGRPTAIGAVRDADGQPLYYVGAAQDITEEYATREALSHRATHDGLTDLGNRDWLQTRLRASLRRADQSGGWVGVCFVDLDRFKLVNDHHGHDAGDALPREVARRLRLAVRRHDGVARVGGDEFVVLVDGLTDPGHAHTVAEAVRASLNRPFAWRGVDIMTTASVGVVVYPDGAPDADALLTAADDAMYRAKAEGRDRVELHDAEASAARREDDRLRELLRLRLEEAEIHVAFQPIVHIRDGTPVGAEALARMVDDRGRPVSPDRFIPLAEQEGKISAVGAEVTRRALAGLATWPTPATGAPLYVSINVAAAQLHGDLTPQHLVAACGAHGVDPSRVVLEVVERTVIDEETAQRKALTDLQGTGARLALDDFGTGYSALSYLVDLDASIVKLDRSFVSRLPDDTRAAAMVRGLVGLLLHLGHTIVAEGIETEAQRRFLADAGCQLGQGYLWSRPLAPQDFLAWLAACPDRGGRAEGDAPG